MKKKIVALSSLYLQQYPQTTEETIAFIKGIKERIQDKPCPDADKVINYLMYGVFVGQNLSCNRGLFDHVIYGVTPPRENWCGINLYTDGVWV